MATLSLAICRLVIFGLFMKLIDFNSFQFMIYVYQWPNIDMYHCIALCIPNPNQIQICKYIKFMDLNWKYTQKPIYNNGMTVYSYIQND